MKIPTTDTILFLKFQKAYFVEHLSSDEFLTPKTDKNGVTRFVLPTESTQKTQKIESMMYEICRIMLDNQMVNNNYTWTGQTRNKNVQKLPFKELKNFISWIVSLLRHFDKSISSNVVLKFFAKKYCKHMQRRVKNLNKRKSSARGKFTRKKRIIDEPVEEPPRGTTTGKRTRNALNQSVSTIAGKKSNKKANRASAV